MKIFRPVILLTGIAAVLMAADFWEKKKFPDWNQGEVQKMLTDSPWARPVLISSATMMGLPQSPVQEAARPGEPCPTCADRAPHTSAGSVELPRIAPTMNVIVRWHSALPVKQALVKARFGNEAASSAAAREFLEREENAYVICLAGIPPQSLPGDAEEIKSRSVLRIKDAPPVPAQQVQAATEGGAVTVFLAFPKGQGGSHVITVEDKEVEVDVKLATISVRRKFKLKDMVYEGKLAL